MRGTPVVYLTQCPENCLSERSNVVYALVNLILREGNNNSIKVDVEVIGVYGTKREATEAKRQGFYGNEPGTLVVRKVIL